MSIHLISIAVEHIDEAASMTPNKQERNELKEVTTKLRNILQKRGVFIGEPREREQHVSRTRTRKV